MTITTWVYIILFVIVGVPLIGYISSTLNRFGKHLYSEYAFIRKFFDDYSANWALGALFTVACLFVYFIVRWLGFV